MPFQYGEQTRDIRYTTDNVDFIFARVSSVAGFLRVEQGEGMHAFRERMSLNKVSEEAYVRDLGYTLAELLNAYAEARDHTDNWIWDTAELQRIHHRLVGNRMHRFHSTVDFVIDSRYIDASWPISLKLSTPPANHVARMGGDAVTLIRLYRTAMPRLCAKLLEAVTARGRLLSHRGGILGAVHQPPMAVRELIDSIRAHQDLQLEDDDDD